MAAGEVNETIEQSQQEAEVIKVEAQLPQG